MAGPARMLLVDLSDPTVRSAVIALAGVALAASVGLVGAIIGARIAANASKASARLAAEEAKANRDEARSREERDEARAARERRRVKGVEAAEKVLDLLNEIDLGPFSLWRALERRTGL